MTDIPDGDIHLECKREGRAGKFAVILRLPDGDNLVRYLVLADPEARAAWADEMYEKQPGINRDEWLKALENEAARQITGEDGGNGGCSWADRLVSLVLGTDGVELFHCPEGETYATVPIGDHRETWKISSRGFKDWISNQSLTHLEKVPGSQSLQDAIGALAGRAKFQGPEHSVHIRVAEFGGDVWIDLCDRDWRAVCVSPEGWRVVVAGDVPVKFIRRKGMLSLPEPARDGSIEDLRPLLNMPDEDTWTLAVGWIVGALRPHGPYGVLSISGEAGSAKSTVSRLIRGLIDPNISPLRRLPKTERDIFITAGNGWVAVYNNMSGIRAELSDALCALTTDGGFATRALYADDEESIFSARRPAILNGIDEPATRPDLVDRSISLWLKRITEDDRRTEKMINAEYERVRAGVLGALLDAVSCALRNVAGVSLPGLPRMADLVVWVTAAEEALGWEPGRFYRAFTKNQAESDIEIVAASPIGPPILDLLEDGPFEGNATKLLEVLNRRRGDNPVPDEWPKNYSGMSSKLKRIAQNLRGVGVEVQIAEKAEGHGKVRLIRLAKTGNQRDARTAHAADADGGGGDVDAMRSIDDDDGAATSRKSQETRRTDDIGVQPGAGSGTDAERAARAERPVRTQSNKGDDPWRS